MCVVSECVQVCIFTLHLLLQGLVLSQFIPKLSWGWYLLLEICKIYFGDSYQAKCCTGYLLWRYFLLNLECKVERHYMTGDTQYTTLPQKRASQENAGPKCGNVVQHNMGESHKPCEEPLPMRTQFNTTTGGAYLRH